MAINAADWSIGANGDIRYTGTTTNNTVIEMHRWLGDLMDDAAAAGNDILDITDSTASERSTDNIITLKYPYNIDDLASQHLYDGSVIQSTSSSNLGENIYDGILIFAPASTYIYVMQNGNIVTPNFWTTGLNADAANGISHRFMLKVRSGGNDIDGRRLIGVTREFSKTYSQFPINGTSRGNNVMALTSATDLNNATSAATVKGWTTVSNTEGYRALDIDGNTVNEYYYSEWNKATYTINQFYERLKWLTRRTTSEDSSTDTGSDFAVGNATITGQAQSFTVGSNAVYLTRVFANLKKVGVPTGNLVAKVYTHSGTYGTSSVPSGPIATVASAPTAGGTGYTVNDVLNVSEGTGGQVTASTVSAGVVTAVTFTAAGTGGYTIGTGKATTGGTGTGCTISITGITARATSVNIDVSKLTTTYQNIEIGFNTQYKMAASTYFVITFEYTAGNASNYVHVKGLATTGTHGGNRAQYASAVWTATAADDLNFDVYASPELYGKNGEIVRGITHEVALTTPRTGSFSATEMVSWGTGATAGTGIMFAIDSVTAGTKMWIQLLTGVAPSASVTITGTTSTATATNTGSPTERSLSYPLCGASTGSAIIGSYGFGIEPTDLTASDKLFDLSNTQRTPPNNVTFTVGGLVSGEDRILVGPATGSNLLENQFTLATALTGAAEVAVVVSAAIPTDTPSTGTIRVRCNSGIYKRCTYTSYTSATFTIDSANFSGDNADVGNYVFISYIDVAATGATASFTGVYLADRSLFIRVRDGGATPIKTFETTGTLGSAGGSSTAIRTSDT